MIQFRNLGIESGLRSINKNSYIYIASPYNHIELSVRIARANEAASFCAQMMNQDFIVYSPIVHNHPVAMVGDLGRDWDYWKRFDTVMLEKSIGLIILKIPGFAQSKGVAAELMIASELNLPVYRAELINMFTFEISLVTHGESI